MYGRLRWGRPAQTLTTGFGSMGQGRYVHPSRRRTLTPHEAARIQTFPDGIFDFGGARRTALARMIGNAVPPLLNIALGLELIPKLVDCKSLHEDLSRMTPSPTPEASSPDARNPHDSGQAQRDTAPEMQLRSALHLLGLRYRVQVAPLPGLRRRADIVFPRQRVAVFIDGCFWHSCAEHGDRPPRPTEPGGSKATRKHQARRGHEQATARGRVGARSHLGARGRCGCRQQDPVARHRSPACSLAADSETTRRDSNGEPLITVSPITRLASSVCGLAPRACAVRVRRNQT